jgi:hypothetical protein
MRGIAMQQDTHELDTIHALSTNVVGEPTEEKLTDEGTDRGRDLETEVLVGRIGATLVVDVADHECDDGDGEDVVRISEETDTFNRCQLVLCDEYHEGFKNNVPATMQVLTWNRENLASLTSARAARRRSPAVMAAFVPLLWLVWFFSASGGMVVENKGME